MLGETGDVRTSGPDAAVDPVRGSGKQGNGASPFEYDLLHALQSMRVGDFSAKPVNTEQQLSALRMWLHR
jgi:hypothetical protein